jgi:folate-binding protein YgfZ
MHFGDPFGEQRRFFAGEAVIPCTGWEVVELSGPDRGVWLDALATNDLKALPPRHTAESLILSPQGRVEHSWLMVEDGASSWLLVEPGRAEALTDWLRKMVFRYDVTIAEHPHSFTVYAAWGDRTLAHLATRQDVVTWRDPWPGVTSGGFAYSGDPHPGAGFSLHFVGVPDGIGDVFSGVGRAGLWALDAADVPAGRPRRNFEVDDKTLPHEVDWLRTAVHLNKGCYRGQETVAKVHNLGHPPRRIVILHLDGSTSVLPQPGDSVVLGEKAVGFITRAVRHHEWGPIALAVIKRSVAGDVDLVVDTSEGLVSAAQQVLVTPEAGRVNAPDFPRR